MSKLLKTLMPGGIVTLTDRELVLGEGWLGTRNVRRYPLQALIEVELLPSLEVETMHRHMRVRFVWNDGHSIDVDGIGPIAAQRIYGLLHALYGREARR